MEPYFLYGTVLPERAQLSLQTECEFEHIASGVSGRAKLSIVLNQIAVWIDSQHSWDIYDLRNLVESFVSNELAVLGYLKGYAYEVQITRIVHQSRGIDFVFGIDIPCLSSRNSPGDIDVLLSKIRELAVGKNGVFLHRCFSDLISAMRRADDTAFYCYRAIEALRHHCAAVFSLSNEDRGKQWTKFREISDTEEAILLELKTSADPLRHGGLNTFKSDDREKLFKVTWDIVDRYLGNQQADPI